jgi:hypothetical protein
MSGNTTQTKKAKKGTSGDFIDAKNRTSSLKVLANNIKKNKTKLQRSTFMDSDNWITMMSKTDLSGTEYRETIALRCLARRT